MDTPMEGLDAALLEHGHKLVDLTAITARRAAEEGSRVVLVAASARRFAPEEAELLLDGGDQRIWGCAASRERLITWLADDEILAVCADAQPAIRLSSLEIDSHGEDRQSIEGG